MLQQLFMKQVPVTTAVLNDCFGGKGTVIIEAGKALMSETLSMLPIALGHLIATPMLKQLKRIWKN